MAVLSAQVADPLPVARPHRFWTTPRWLVLLGVTAALLAAGLGLLVGMAATGVRAGFDVIGQQAAPQVRVSSDLYFALSDLDAQAANVLLVGTGTALAADRTAALNTYDQRRTQADHDLDQAAANAGTDPAAQRMISATLDQLGRYESLTAQAFLINQQGNDPVGRPSPAALARYRQATDTMRTTLAGIQQLINRNNDILATTYANERGAALGARIWLGLLGGLVIVALAGLQVHLRLRLRRRTNPALLLATLVVLLLTVLSIGLLSDEAGHLKVAKSDAFDSITALSQARSISYDANADESRFLVDPQRASQYQQSFLDKSQSLLDLPGTGLVQYDSALAGALTAYHANNTDVRFTGFYGVEMRNITFTGERAAAEQVLAAYQTYQRDDRHLRALASAGNLNAAVTFDIGTAPGNSDHDFVRYDNALMALIQINQNAFTTAVHDGQQEVAGWTTLVPGIGALLIIGLIGIGIWPRIAEYR